METPANRPKDRAEYGFVVPSLSFFRIMGYERWGGGRGDLGDSCSDKMGQMECIESVRMCFIAADNVIAVK